MEIAVSRLLSGFDGEAVELACAHGGRRFERRCRSLVLVTARDPVLRLHEALVAAEARWAAAGIRSVTRIGDCLAPALTADAVFSGHRYAQELDADVDPDRPFARERIVIAPPPSGVARAGA